MKNLDKNIGNKIVSVSIFIIAVLVLLNVYLVKPEKVPPSHRWQAVCECTVDHEADDDAQCIPSNCK